MPAGGGPGDKFDSAFDFYFEKPTIQLLPEQANFMHGKELKRTCKVGSYEPNRLGLFDMHGNVGEWCGDVDPNDPQGAKGRLFRGGCWGDRSGGCTAGCVYRLAPWGRGHYLGVRLARVRVGKEMVKIGVTAPTEEQLRQRIETAWPGLGNRLVKDKAGNYALNLGRGPQVPDLTPLRDMPLTALDFNGNDVLHDLTPLQGMKLKWLGLGWCHKIRDL